MASQMNEVGRRMKLTQIYCVQVYAILVYTFHNSNFLGWTPGL